MERNHAQCPDDDNGDVLWRMLLAGDNLDTQREIDFSVIFPSEGSALKFAEHLLRNQQKVSFSSYEGNDELPWQVQVHSVMLPSHDTITKFEELLAADAEPLGGRNDGWGCFAME
jgi:hypothetical protein